MFNKYAVKEFDMPAIYAWNLFWWKVEGCSTLNGLNVYRPSDPHSAGFILKAGWYGIRLRYSKRTKEWHFQIGRGF